MRRGNKNRSPERQNFGMTYLKCLGLGGVIPNKRANQIFMINKSFTMILINASQERKKQDNSDGSVDGGVCVVVFVFGHVVLNIDKLQGLRIIICIMIIHR